MARPESLVPGNCFFRVHFHDDDLLFPYVETLRYVRCDTSDEGPLWLFYTWLLADDDVDGVPESEGSPGEIFEGVPAGQLREILDFGGVVAKPQEISACHPLLPPPLRTLNRRFVRCLPAWACPRRTVNLIDRGRTRIFAYPMPDDPTAAIGLCTAVLTEGFRLRADDALDYHPLSRSELQT